jgi:hypothetical protein
MFSVSSGPFFGPTNIDMEEYAMSLDQITVSDGFLVFWTVLGWLVIIIFMVTMRRKFSRLRADFKLLSYEVTALKTAEERRLVMEINAPSRKADHVNLETGRTAVPSIVPAHLEVPANAVSDPKHWRDCAEQMRVMSDWTKDAEAKATMLKLADDYDALAERCGPPASTSQH